MEIARHWRLREQRYGLTGTICTKCGKRFFTERMVCDSCNSISEDDSHHYEAHRTPIDTPRTYEMAHR